MNDLKDLADLLQDLERHAPDLAGVQTRLARGLTDRRHRAARRVVPLLAAAVVVALAVGLTLALGGGRGKPVPAGQFSTSPAVTGSAAPSAPDSRASQLRSSVERQASSAASATSRAASAAAVTPMNVEDAVWQFTVRPVPGYAFAREVTTTGYQQAVVTQLGAVKDIGEVDVYPAGPAAPADLTTMTGSQTVQVNGTTGRFGVVTSDSDLRAALIWQLRPGTWAVVVGDWGSTGAGLAPDTSIARGPELAIARAVVPASDAVRADFRLGWLPAGLSVSGTTYFGPTRGGPSFELDLVDDIPGVPTPVTPGPAVSINRSPDVQSSQPGSTFRPNLSIDGRPAEYSESPTGRSVAVRYPDGTIFVVSVDANHLNRYSKADVIRIATEAAPVGTPGRTASWLPLTKALPG